MHLRMEYVCAALLPRVRMAHIAGIDVTPNKGRGILKILAHLPERGPR